jgi:imidazoleglycerol-phosphate dehydratase
MRTGRIARKTAETDILVEVNLDGTGCTRWPPGSAFSTT